MLPNENRANSIIGFAQEMLADSKKKHKKIEELEKRVATLQISNSILLSENSYLCSNRAESQIAKLKEELTFAQKFNCSLSDEIERLKIKAAKQSPTKSIHFTTESYGELKAPSMPIFRSSITSVGHCILYNASSNLADALMNQLELLIQKSATANELNGLFTHLLKSMK